MFSGVNDELFDKNKKSLFQLINMKVNVRKYLLIDPAISDELSNCGFELSDKLPIPINHPNMSEQSKPYLVEIRDDENGRSLLDLSLKLAISETTRDTANPKRFRSMCAWLTSYDDIHLLSEKLALKSVIRITHQREILFRFYDPRVMDLLLEVVDSEQFSNGLNRLSGWFWLSRKAELQSYSFTITKTNAPLWYLTENQQLRLSRVSWINKCMDKQYVYSTLCRNTMSIAELDELFELIKDRYAITKQDDALSYVHYALTVNRNFNKHPEIAKILDSFDQDKELLSVLLNSVDQNIWNQLTY